jgi:alkylation response protein AidB-like acyl-CoA dehydrogenase
VPPVVRSLPSEEARELLQLTLDLVDREVAPQAAEMESRSAFPREVFRTLGKAGLLGLPYDEQYGGAAQPYEVYLQVLEELSRGWLAVGLGVSVHTLACYPLAAFGTDEQRERWLPDLVGGELLGAYCLSEAGSGSDAAALQTRAVRDGDAFVVDGAKGGGFRIAMSALDGGRLGIAACAVGLAQAALDVAVDYAQQRQQFGKRIADFQGVSFLLADMATSIEAARALYLSAARRRDAGQPFGTQAAMSKLFATDTAMRVATDAVQVLGGYGYVEDFPAERYLREAKILQIVEGTNQIQRVVIGRALTS